MVLKGQIFMLDVSFAFFVLILAIISFLSIMMLMNKSMAIDYSDFVRQKRLLDASEKLISAELADYSENTLKHHVLSLEKIGGLGRMGVSEVKRDLLLEDYDIYLSITIENRRILEIGEKGGMSVKRIALCGGEACVLELNAR